MSTRTIVLCFVVLLGAPMISGDRFCLWHAHLARDFTGGTPVPLMARAQDGDDWPSLSYLRSDYRQVAVVAHVRVREAEIVKTIGGYEDWRLVGEVVEPFKGKFRKGQLVEYYLGAEKGFRKEILLGEKIVFLFRNFVQEKKRWVLAVLENSTLPYTEDRALKLRKIQHSTKHSPIKRK